MSARDELRALSLDFGGRLPDDTIVDLCRLADKYHTTPQELVYKAVTWYVASARRALR